MAYDFRACAVEPEGSGVKNDLSVVSAGYGSHVRERESRWNKVDTLLDPSNYQTNKR